MTLPLGKIVQGDALTVLRGWPDGCVQCVVTSPPYWGLRDYRVDGASIDGQWGREPTLEEHIAVLVNCFREIRRVLRPDGTVWLNYGDAYAAQSYGTGGGWAVAPAADGKQRNQRSVMEPFRPQQTIPPKNLLLLPFRVAMALQADGWWLRAYCPWIKRNGMPESASDRPTTGHEALFLLSKAPRYFYDAEAVRVKYAQASLDRADDTALTDGKTANKVGFKRTISHSGRARKTGDWWRESVAGIAAECRVEATALLAQAAHLEEILAGGGDPQGLAVDADGMPLGLYLPTQGYPGAHFATFPDRLVVPCIKAGTSEKGACPACGAPWVRRVEQDYKSTDWKPWQTTGWAPSCDCNAGAPVPCVVLDPFAGSGTTGVVAHKMGRAFVGIDLAGGDACLGMEDADAPPCRHGRNTHDCHTAHDRLAAASAGRTLAEWQGHQEAGQTDMLEESE